VRLWDTCGNRLLVIVEPADDTDLVAKSSIASRCWHEGERIADGIAWFAPRDGFFRTAFFNPDGSLERLCGNSLLVAAATLSNGSPVIVRPFEYAAVEVHTAERVRASATVPWQLVMRETSPAGPIYDTGSPHLVLERDQVFDLDLPALARPLVESLNVNVTLYSLVGEVAHVRTFERGVNAETLACGTGALAVGMAVGREVEIRYPGGTYGVRAERKGDQVSWTFSTFRELVRLAEP
jgi:diaminopimelate epimerase